jgi:hypothetical protein
MCKIRKLAYVLKHRWNGAVVVIDLLPAELLQSAEQQDE